MEPHLHFPDNLGPDSLDLVEIVMAYEEAYDEEIGEEEMGRLRNFSSKEKLIDYLRRRRKGGQ